MESFHACPYSRLPNGSTPEIRELIDDSSEAFGCYQEIVFHYRGWQKRLDKVCLGRENGIERDTLIGFYNDWPFSCWQFSFSDEKHEAYGEGVFVHPFARGHSIGIALLESLFETFRERDIERFYVGYHRTNERSAYVRRSVCAQKFARTILKKCEDRIIEVAKTPKGFVRNYAINV